MADYRPDPAILSLGDEFADPVEPARFPKAIPRFLNRRAAGEVGLSLDDEAWEAHFQRFEPLPDNLERPLALRYHGHQFRHYNPDIGDGRGFLFAQLRDKDGRLLDLGTKGSGQTPYSRFGDGRLTLKGGVREVLASEMLEALGVPTSRSFALFETGEELQRNDEPSPTRSSVLTRLSHSHVRIGTFQRLAFFKNGEAIDRLVQYCLGQLFDEPGADAARLFDLVAERTARLAAAYLVAGFVHGVLNSDNINVTGESFDYGPWRFAPEWDEEFVAAYFDQQGLYAFGHQPEAIHWDLAQLGGCMAMVADKEALEATLAGWPDQFQNHLVGALIARLGIQNGDSDEDLALAGAILAALRTRTVGIDRFFFDWRGGRRPGADVYDTDPFRALAKRLNGREATSGALDHPYWNDAAPCAMLIDEVEAIWERIATDDDWSAFDGKIAAVRRMGEAMADATS